MNNRNTKLRKCQCGGELRLRNTYRVGGGELELAAAAASSQSDFSKFISDLDDMITKAILGQQGTSAGERPHGHPRGRLPVVECCSCTYISDPARAMKLVEQYREEQ